MKYNLMITANTDNDSVLIHSDEFNFNPMVEPMMFHAFICKIMPTIDWQLDDGEDSCGTEYCAYVSYTEKNHDHYLYATWCSDEYLNK